MTDGVFESPFCFVFDFGFDFETRSQGESVKRVICDEDDKQLLSIHIINNRDKYQNKSIQIQR